VTTTSNETQIQDLLERILVAVSAPPAPAQAAIIPAEQGRVIVPVNNAAMAEDRQSGQMFMIQKETRLATIVASISGLYSASALVFFIWMALDTLLQKHTLLDGLGYNTAVLNSDGYRLLAVTGIAGALGGTVDTIRSLIHWHAEREAYAPRFIWRDIAMPWIGGVIGVLTYVIVRSGTGLINGDFSPNESGGVTILAAAALGFLGGFSSRKAFRWLDDRGNVLFSTARGQSEDAGASASSTPAVPDALPAPATPPQLPSPDNN
jgi:hypothetical protein